MVDAVGAARISGILEDDMDGFPTDREAIADQIDERFPEWGETRRTAFAGAIEDQRQDRTDADLQTPDPDNYRSGVSFDKESGRWRNESGQFDTPEK